MNVLLQRNNKFGNFLELSEYGEKGRRSFVIFPEGEEGKGWMDCRVQLSKLKQFHDKQKVGEPLPGGHTGKSVAGATGLIKGQWEISTAHINMQGVHKSFAEIVKGSGHFLKVNPQQVAGKDKGGEHFFEKSKATVKPLEDASSNDLEQAEKTKEEHVDILTFRDLLSDFKKDLFQCIERFFVGWTPLNAEVNRAKKGVSNGRPKPRLEKPKPLVKLTYFRKNYVRPKTRWQKVTRPIAGEGGESSLAKSRKAKPLEAGPDPFQALQDSLAERFIEKGESSRVGMRPDSSSPLPASPIQHSRTSPDATSGLPARDLATFSLSSPAGISQDQFSPEIVQGSASECDTTEIQLRILENQGRSPVSG